MRRFLLLLLAAASLYSCATTDEVPSEEPAETQQEADISDDTSAQATPGDVADPDVVDVEAIKPIVIEPEPEPVPTELRFLSPEDLTIFESRDLAILAEGIGDAVVELSGIEMELLGGVLITPDVRGFVELDAGALPDELRIVELPLSSGAATAQLPPGVVDGERYTWRARGIVQEDESTTEWTDVYSTAVRLGTSGPSIVPMGPTIDTTPTIGWIVDDEAAFYEIRVLDSSGDVASIAVVAENESVSDELVAGRYTAAVRTYRKDGIVTRPGNSESVRIRDDLSPLPAWPRDGEQTFGANVGLQWRDVSGAAFYEARYRSVDSEDWSSGEITAATRIPIQVPLVIDRLYEWQVRARNEAGTWFPWSEAASFVVQDHDIEFRAVIANGGTAILQRGYSEGSRDERPVRPITLRVPFEMSTSPLSNTEVALLANFAIEKGMVDVSASGVYTVGDEPIPLIGLGEMDYGEQFGLKLVDGRLQPASGYEEHPAIGITWKGAVQIANLLSYVEGRSPAYDDAGEEWDPTSDGYRLPSEAEWEYAARGTTTRLFPWGGTLSGRAANYYRSFDPFEDVNEPYVGRGGPTTPTGYFGGFVNNGFQTVNDASPFGIRDLVGNVWEWCWDRYDPGYYEVSPDIDPVGPAEADFASGSEAIVLAVALDPSQRVVRGTAWNSRATDVRLTNRGRYTELGRSYSIGVRLVRSPH